MEDSGLEAFVEPIDIMKYFNTDEPYDWTAFQLLDKRPSKERDAVATLAELEEFKKHGNAVLRDYGRGYTQTLTDAILEKYSEGFIIKALNTVLKRSCRQYLVIPDYSPKDGRLHFHGIINFTQVKDLAKLKRMLKNFGWSSIDTEPSEGTVDYMFKIYEKNKYTSKNFRIEPIKLKHILVKF